MDISAHVSSLYAQLQIYQHKECNLLTNINEQQYRLHGEIILNLFASKAASNPTECALLMSYRAASV